MKGFRDLDPGEAEQVVTSRRRKIEHIEEELYAPLMDGYDAAPSEAAPKSRRPREAAGPREEKNYGTPEVTYDTTPKQPKKPRYEEPEVTYDATPKQPRRPRYEEPEVEYNTPKQPKRPSYEEPDDYYEEPEDRYYEEPRPQRDTKSASVPRRDRQDNRFNEQDNRPRRKDSRSRRPDRRADDRYVQEEVQEDAYYIYDEEPDGEDFFYEDLTVPGRNGRRRGAAPMRRHTALIIRNAVLVTALFAAAITCIVMVSGQIKKRKAAPEPEPVKQEASLPPLDELPGAEEWTGENGGGAADLEPEELPEEPEALSAPSEEAGIFYSGYEIHETGSTVELTDEDVRSEFAVLIDMKTGEVIAGKNADEIIAPASMTKILTLLVATEHLGGQEKLDDTTIMTQEIGDLVYRKDLSAVGYKVGDVIPVKDLLYGTILPSGADAAMLLAEYVAGSQEAFVDLMNEKVAELGLSETAKFANVVGLYDPDNHCTVKDMAMILKAAVENDLCREVLSAHIYTTAPTQDHPDGIEISNWFLRRIEDKDTHGDVICAKTGFVDQSGCCAASYQISTTGGRYICVTGNTWSSWQCIYDHVGLYSRFT